jgi:hypothetical protein
MEITYPEDEEMSKRRNLFAQFGSVSYSTGEVLNTSSLPDLALVTLEFNETKGQYYAVPSHDDQFIDFGSNNMPFTQNRWATYHTFDLRDLMKDNEGMFDVVVDIQRAYECPAPGLTYNPGPGNVEETILVVLGDCDLEQIQNSGDPIDFPQVGFVQPLATTTASQLGKHTSVIYAENRIYREDSEGAMRFSSNLGTSGTFGGTGLAADPTQFTSFIIPGWDLKNHVVRGYDQLITGPYVTVIRSWAVYPANRTLQSFDGNGATDAPAKVLTFGSMGVEVTTPALQINISGTQKALTDSQIATYYSSMLIQ